MLRFLVEIFEVLISLPLHIVRAIDQRLIIDEAKWEQDDLVRRSGPGNLRWFFVGAVVGLILLALH